MAIGKKLIIPAVLLAVAAPVGWALAQGGADAPMRGMGPGMGPGMMGPGMGPGMMEHGWGRMRDVSPETLQRLQEGRIAMAKTALKLNDAQLKLWEPVEQQMRQSFTERQKRREEFRKEREQRRAAADKQPDQRPERPSMSERLERMSKMSSDRAERLKAFSTAFKPFYDSLSVEQKAVAEIVLRDMGRGRHGHREGRHHRWAMGNWFGRGSDAAPTAPDAAPSTPAAPAAPVAPQTPPAKK